MHTSLHAAPSDYNDPEMMECTLGIGNNRCCTTITIINDDVLEGSEMFFARLRTPDSAATVFRDTALIIIFEDLNDGEIFNIQ